MSAIINNFYNISKSAIMILSDRRLSWFKITFSHSMKDNNNPAKENKRPINIPTPWDVREVSSLFKDVQLVND